MASINDSAGIFSGGALELFNEMQRLTTRDGDQIAVRQIMVEAMGRATATTQVTAAGSGSTSTRRKQ